MWHRAFLILFLSLFFLGLMGAGDGTGFSAGFAQDRVSSALEDDIYTVQGLAVDETARSALAARGQALRVGQRRALALVLRRITQRSDYPALPNPDDKAIAQLVAAVQVTGEKTSTVRYLATLTVRFDRTAVRELLRNIGISYSETRAKPTLVLPVFEKGAALALFEDSNVWRAAWDRLDLGASALLPLRLPKGDLQDITTITAEGALAGNEGQLRAMALRYGVENIMVAHAVLSIDLQAGGVPRVDVTLLRFGPRGKSTEVLDYSIEVGQGLDRDLGGAMDRLALRLVTDQQENWKRLTQLTFGTETSLSALVPLRGLAEWLAVRQRLEATAIVRSITLHGISRQDAQVVIDFFGDTDSLVVSLAQRDLHLALIDGFWELRLAKKGRMTTK